MPPIKVLVVGEGGVGKTSFIRRHYNGEFYTERSEAERSEAERSGTERSEAERSGSEAERSGSEAERSGSEAERSGSEEEEVKDENFNILSVRHKLKFIVGDVETTTTTTKEKEKVVLDVIESCSEEKLIPDLNACIIMFDVTDRRSYDSVSKIYENLIKLYKRIPIVLCGNKVDCKDREVMPVDITFHQGRPIQYYDISAKSNYNFEKPFLYIIRKVLGKRNLVFTEEDVPSN